MTVWLHRYLNIPILSDSGMVAHVSKYTGN